MRLDANRVLRWLPLASAAIAVLMVALGLYTLTYTRSHSADAIASATAANCNRENEIIEAQNRQAKALRVILLQAQQQIDTVPKDRLPPNFDTAQIKREYQDLIDASQPQAWLNCTAIVQARLRQ